MKCEKCGAEFQGHRDSQQYCSYRCSNGSRIRIPKDPTARFERGFKKVENSCWEWGKSRFKNGYGKFSSKLLGEEYAHRVSFRLYRGGIPEGIHVLHTCDNPCCVNPDHLFLGTQLDNMQDMIRKGRKKSPPKGTPFAGKSYVGKGEENGRAVVTSRTVRAIRKQYKRGRAEALAKKYKISSVQVLKIVRREAWPHVQ